MVSEIFGSDCLFRLLDFVFVFIFLYILIINFASTAVRWDNRKISNRVGPKCSNVTKVGRDGDLVKNSNVSSRIDG